MGASILLALNDVVSRFTEYNGLALGLVILAVTLGLRRGLLDFAAAGLARLRARPARDGQVRDAPVAP